MMYRDTKAFQLVYMGGNFNLYFQHGFRYIKHPYALHRVMIIWAFSL
jgi:hypothetical protein